MEYDSYIYVTENTWWKGLQYKTYIFDNLVFFYGPNCKRCNRYITKGNFFENAILCNNCFWVKKNNIIQYIIKRESKI